MVKCEKTSIRLNDEFVIKEGSKYFLSGISKVGEWSKIKTKDLENLKGKDVTKKLQKLLKKYELSESVNFIVRRSHKKIGKRGASKKTKKKKDKKDKGDKKITGGDGRWGMKTNKRLTGNLMLGGSGWNSGNNQDAETVSTGGQ